MAPLAVAQRREATGARGHCGARPPRACAAAPRRRQESPPGMAPLSPATVVRLVWRVPSGGWAGRVVRLTRGSRKRRIRPVTPVRRASRLVRVRQAPPMTAVRPARSMTPARRAHLRAWVRQLGRVAEGRVRAALPRPPRSPAPEMSGPPLARRSDQVARPHRVPTTPAGPEARAAWAGWGAERAGAQPAARMRPAAPRWPAWTAQRRTGPVAPLGATPLGTTPLGATRLPADAAPPLPTLGPGPPPGFALGPLPAGSGLPVRAACSGACRAARPAGCAAGPGPPAVADPRGSAPCGHWADRVAPRARAGGEARPRPATGPAPRRLRATRRLALPPPRPPRAPGGPASRPDTRACCR
jgi:hypothetical protein